MHLLLEEATLPYEEREYYLFSCGVWDLIMTILIEYRALSQNVQVTGSIQTTHSE